MSAWPETVAASERRRLLRGKEDLRASVLSPAAARRQSLGRPNMLSTRGRTLCIGAAVFSLNPGLALFILKPVTGRLANPPSPRPTSVWPHGRSFRYLAQSSGWHIAATTFHSASVMRNFPALAAPPTKEILRGQAEA